MSDHPSGRLIILSGPSCVGKSPLAKALARLYPELHHRLQPLVLYTSRSPRPGEMDDIDYHFREKSEIEALGNDSRYLVMNVRGDAQALDMQELSRLLARGDVFFEGNPFVGRALLTHPTLAGFERLSAFMSPLSREEIIFLKGQEGVTLAELVTDVMCRKLLRRSRRQKGELSLKDLENTEKRAASAYDELKEAYRFAHVIPNHDGEDSENWDAFYHPLGDARIALLAFVALLTGQPPKGTEQWEKGLLP